MNDYVGLVSYQGHLIALRKDGTLVRIVINPITGSLEFILAGRLPNDH